MRDVPCTAQDEIQAEGAFNGAMGFESTNGMLRRPAHCNNGDRWQLQRGRFQLEFRRIACGHLRWCGPVSHAQDPIGVVQTIRRCNVTR